MPIKRDMLNETQFLDGGRVLLSDKNPVGGEETNKAFQEVRQHVSHSQT